MVIPGWIDIVSNLKTTNLLSTETEDVLSEYQAPAIKSNLDIELNITNSMRFINQKILWIIFVKWLKVY